MKVYLVVVNDKYELPVYEGVSMGDVARRFSLTTSNISRACSEKRPICHGKYRIVVMECEEERIQHNG